MKRVDQSPASLLQCFDAPDGYQGTFAWICGYSADADFLNAAMQRFTRLSAAQRAHEGSIHALLMLDPGNPPITLVQVPGVAHAPILSEHRKSFRLMHAKLALLGFRRRESDAWRLRLLVSTGNWTRGTVEKSLDLVWRDEVGSDDLPASGRSVRTCSDIAFAWDALSWLRERYDQRLLSIGTGTGYTASTRNGDLQMQGWVEEARRSASGKPRLFDNRRRSLLRQLPQMVEREGGLVRRNYLCMGSGFYEGGEGGGQAPKVPAAIVTGLGEAGLLTRDQPEVDIFVNPDACQAIAESAAAIESRGWTIRAAVQPEFLRSANLTKDLHAKFIFSANHRSGSLVASSPWIYLGSGNLTGPGFMQAAGPAGNYELGVVIAPDAPLHWTPGKKRVDGIDAVTQRLPVGWDGDSKIDASKLKCGSEMPERKDLHTASPVAFVRWVNEAGEPMLAHDPVSEELRFEILDTAGLPCKCHDHGVYRWCGDAPRMVDARWWDGDVQMSAEIPVVDAHGRVAASPLQPIEFEDAWSILLDFPDPPPDEALAADAVDDVPEDVSTRSGSSSSQAQYPLRQMMSLIEMIASMQTSISRRDWFQWCDRLQQTLERIAGTSTVLALRAMEVDPIEPLFQPPFRPDFAEDQTTPEGARYEQVLTGIRAAWLSTDTDTASGSGSNDR